MDFLNNFILHYQSYAPLIIFALLLLAGFNIPVSEDGMLFISAYLAKQNPDMIPAYFLGVYGGAYFSDLISYSLGRILGPKLLKIKWFSNLITKQRQKRIQGFYKKYGIMTLIIGRFIPFGVRNGLFITAGFGKMKFIKFALSDLLACTISTIVFFSLYYNFGDSVVTYIKKWNLVIFAIALILLIIYFIFKKSKKHKLNKQV